MLITQLGTQPSEADHRGDVNCTDFSTQAAAQAHLRAHPTDPDELDTDHGVACESLPCLCNNVPIGPPTPTPTPAATATPTPTPSPSLEIEGQLEGCFEATNIVYGHNNQTEQWLAFEPGAPDFLQTLTELVAGGGYLINLETTCQMSAGASSLSLYPGWNIFGWPLAEPTSGGDIEEHLEFCLSSVNIANGMNNQTKVWATYEPGAPDFLQTLGEFVRGGGYFINASSDCHLAFGNNHFNIYTGWNLFGWR